MPGVTSPAYIDSHRMSRSQWSALLAQPDVAASYFGDERRAEQRIGREQIIYFGLDLSDTNMPRDRFLVRTRDISESGIGFLHGTPVETGLRCKVAMLSVDQRLVTHFGQVASCYDRGDGIYNVGIVFEQPIHVSDFMPE